MPKFRRYKRVGRQRQLLREEDHRGKSHKLRPFTKTAEGRAHGLEKIVGRNLDPSVPDLVRCPCGRIAPEDMIMAYGGEWGCDGCWSHIRRSGDWDDSKVDVEPDA